VNEATKLIPKIVSVRNLPRTIDVGGYQDSKAPSYLAAPPDHDLPFRGFLDCITGCYFGWFGNFLLDFIDLSRGHKARICTSSHIFLHTRLHYLETP